MSRERTIAIIALLALWLWLDRRREIVTSTIHTAPPAATPDWWDIWEWTGGTV